MSSLKERVAAELRARERSQAWLARKVGLDPAYFNRILVGTDKPPARLQGLFVVRIAEALEVPVEALERNGSSSV